MEHVHQPTGHTGADIIGLLLRVLLLTSSAFVAGAGLTRSATAVVARWVVPAAAVAAGTALVSTWLADTAPVFAVAHALLAAAIPAALRWRAVPAYAGFALVLLLIAETATGHGALGFFLDTVVVAASAGWLGHAAARRLDDENGSAAGGIAITAALGLTAASVVAVLTAGLLDERLVRTGYGLLLLLPVPLGICLLVLAAVGGRSRPLRTFRRGSTAAVALLAAWALLPGLPQPGELPVPGVPRVGQVAGGQVLVTPHRPGPNLVQVSAEATEHVLVSAGDRTARAVPRPGSAGLWAEIDLPAGGTDVTVERAAGTGTVDVDTGELPPLASAAGPDGPECAGAALGAAAAGAPQRLTRCPVDALDPGDADSLRGLVSYLDERGVPYLQVAGDRTPRSTAAAEVVRSAAARHDVPVRTGPDGALVLVPGWSAAAERLAETGGGGHLYGVHLAPWLLHAPVVRHAPSVAAPLRFDPRDRSTLEYGAALHERFPGQSPSVAGLRSWNAARGLGRPAQPVLYAAARVDVMQMPGHQAHGSRPAGQWLPGGTVVAVSGPLRDRAAAQRSGTAEPAGRSAAPVSGERDQEVAER